MVKMRIYFKNNIINFAAVVLVVAIAAALLLPRVIAETKNKNVEIAIPYSSVCRLANKYNYRLADLIDRLKSAGATTMILEEETPATLEEESGVLFFSKSDYLRLNLLDVISEGSLVKPGTFVFPSEESRQAYYLKKILEECCGLPDTRVQKGGRYIFVYTGEKANFSSVGVVKIDRDTPLGFSINKIKEVAVSGLRVALLPALAEESPQRAADYVYSRLAVIPVDDKTAPSLSYPLALLPPTSKVSGFYGSKKDAYSSDKIRARFYYVDFEFTDEDLGSGLKNFFGARHSVKGHKITASEKKRFLSAQYEIKRYLRAARERGVRFFVIDMDENINIDENINKIKQITRGFKKIGLRVSAPAIPVAELYPYSTKLSRHSATDIYLKKILSFIAAFIAPAVMIYRLRLRISRRGSVSLWTALKDFLVANIFIIGAGLLSSSFVSSTEFATGSFQRPLGVKFLLLGSFAVAVSVALYDGHEIKNFILAPLKFGHFIAGIFVIFLASVMLLRSGNDGGIVTLPIELRLREFLENVFVWARPRWKEILVGQPCLFLALRYLKKDLLVGAAILVVSVSNTFLHIHTPLGISIYRTLSGAFGGLIIGLALSVAVDFYKKKIKTTFSATTLSQPQL